MFDRLIRPFVAGRPLSWALTHSRKLLLLSASAVAIPFSLALAAKATPSPEAPANAVNLGAMDVIGNASFVVQLVLVILIVFSIVSWAIIFGKWGVMRRSFSNSERFLDIFWSGKSMDHIYGESKKYHNSGVAKIFRSGYEELLRLIDKERQKTHSGSDSPVTPAESSIHNLERALQRANRNEGMRLERSLGFLATAGSTAPFIGLFGTVWGILISFQEIGASGGASLSTVAPRISEALIATAVGLACAIPAVMGYNYYIQKVRSLKAQMDNFAADFLNIIKRNFLAN